MKKKRPAPNYLDMIPVPSPKLRWETDENGLVVLLVDHKGVFDRLAQALLSKPKTTYIHTDAFGSFLWPLLDGTRTVADLAALEHEHFGEDAEPLYPRIIRFMQIMEANGLVTLKKPEAPAESETPAEPEAPVSE